MNRVRTLAVAFAAGLLLAACSQTTPGGDPADVEEPTPTVDDEAFEPAPNTVEVVDIAYEPNDIMVSTGTTVRWTWTGDLQHSVTADDGSFDSDVQDRGFEFAFTFDAPDTYEYYCTLHSTPDGGTMNGTVTVT